MKTIRKFIRNEDGNYAALMALMALPIIGSVAVAVDYSNTTRLKAELRNAADAACVPVAKMYLSGDFADSQVMAKGFEYFKANFNMATKFVTGIELRVTLPNASGNTTKNLTCQGRLTYNTIFGPALAMLTGQDSARYVTVIEESVMKMKNVAEIALVMDNSGSMAEDTVSGGSRLALLKEASKQLVHDLIVEGQKITGQSESVKFSIVPFAGSVNVGSQYRTANWMDLRGIAPNHHENLDWGTMGPTNPTGWRTLGADGAKLDASANPLTRWSILDNLKFHVGGTEVTTAIATSCKVWKSGTTTSSSATDANCAVKDRTGGTATRVIGGTAADTSTIATSMGVTTASLQTKYSWKGCVEARPYPYNVNDELPASGAPATLFIPMFAPDEYNNDRYGVTSNSSTSDGVSALNNWWPDPVNASTRTIGNAFATANPSSGSWQTGTARPRQVDVAKYFTETPYLLGSGTSGSSTSSSTVRKGQWHYFKADNGPNYGCSTPPIQPLIGTESTITSAIDSMVASGSTNVTEGLAWGWRTISKAEPFTEGVADNNRAVDKVIIAFTDGKNTYYTPADLGMSGHAGERSFYGPYGYTGYNNSTGNGVGAVSGATNKSRIFQGTTASATTHTFDNFTASMIQQMNTLCTNIKATDRVLLMTVALDLDPAPTADGPMIAALRNCSGDSRSRKDASGDPEKMFWNACTQPTATSQCTTLEDTFIQIKEELSNLRFVG
jgi:Flp pilus assembly protein TadG